MLRLVHPLQVQAVLTTVKTKIPDPLRYRIHDHLELKKGHQIKNYYFQLILILGSSLQRCHNSILFHV